MNRCKWWVPSMFALFLLGCPSKPVMTVEVPPLTAQPSAVDFGRVWVGRAELREVRVSNPARVTQELPVRVEGGFTAEDFPAQVGADVEVLGHVRVLATAAGALDGTLWLGDAGVSLHALAEQVPDCRPSAVCRDVAFDFDAGVCAETVSVAGTNCAPSFACFSAAQCEAGECVGTLTTCDDGDPCTGDACGESGCVHFDSTFLCQVPNDPCLAPACAPPTGCTTTPVVDGTPCGQRTCGTASICLNGTCATRPAPQTQSCAEVVVGWPAGPGDVDGFARDARFSRLGSMAYHPSGDLFVMETFFFSPGVVAGRVRRVSPNGTARVLAGSFTEAAVRDGFGAAARFTDARFIGIDRRGELLLKDGTSLRRMAPSGFVSTVCAACLTLDWSPVVLPSQQVALIGTDLGSKRSLPLIDPTTGATKTASVRPTALTTYVDGVISSNPVRVCANDILGRSVFQLDALGDGGFGWRTTDAGCVRPQGAQRYRADGTLEAMAIDGPPTDGPLDMVGLSDVTSPGVLVAMDFDGGYALFDSGRFHVRRVEAGVMRTLSGPVAQQGVIDGVAPAARLLTSPAAIMPDDGGVRLVDGWALRRLADGTLSTLADAGVVGRDLALRGDDTLWLGSGQLITFDPTWTATASPVGAGALSLCLAEDGGLLMGFADPTTADGGPEPFSFTRRLRPASAPQRAYVTTALPGNTRKGFFVLGAGQGDSDLAALLNDPDAGWPRLRDFFEESPGVVVGLRGSTIVRLDTRTGQSTDLAVLSDSASSIAPAPDGGVYVGITHAILHVQTR